MTDEMEDRTEMTDEKDYLTTISIWANSTKKRLDSIKLIDTESYDHILNRLLDRSSKRSR
jgi:hypothetical protein